jgi:hypothetical protein
LKGKRIKYPIKESMERKIFTHTPITLPKLKQINVPGLRYYTAQSSKNKFVSITTIISHNTKHKFVKWRKDVGEKEANRVTNRSTVRGTKTHSLIEAYVGNEEQPLLESVFKPEEDEKVENILNPYDRICALNNKLVVDIFKNREIPLRVKVSGSNKLSNSFLDIVHDQFGEIIFEPGTDPDGYNKHILVQAEYQNFIDFCLESLEDSTYYPETVETYKNLPFRLFENLKPELNKIDNVLGIEIPLYSEYFGIAGTSDCIAEYNGILSIIDYTTSEYIKRKDMILDYFVQAVAYRYMLKERTGLDAPQLVIFMMAENGEIKPFIETDFTTYSKRLVQYINNYKNEKIKEINS